MSNSPSHLAKWQDELVFHYESTGQETFFRDTRDPYSRSRRIFTFHTPKTLLYYLKQEKTLHQKLKEMPQLEVADLRDCQIDAIKGLDKALAEDKPRSYSNDNGSWQILHRLHLRLSFNKTSGAKRILFLVDRNSFGDQALKKFQAYEPCGLGRRFADEYIVQHLQSNKIDKDAKVVITTIQRLFSMLKGEELDPENEEKSAFEIWEFGDGEI